MRRFGISCLFVIAAVSLLPAQTPRTIEIEAQDTMKWNVTKITAKPGEALRIKLTSKGVIPKVAMAHNFVLLAPGTDAAALVKAGSNSRDTDYIPVAEKAKVLAMTGLAGPGETVEVTFKVPSAPGTYEFICSFPGHYTLGMKGTLTVK